MSFRIIGTGRCVPEYVLTNEEISTMVETSDEWISTRTGIKERRICTKETITDLAVTAAKNALEDAKAAPEELDMIICGTIRGEFISPSEACVIQKKLGARCPAFDVNAACSGFLYCMDVAAGFFARKRVKKVLVVCADNVSNCSDWNDRATCVLFGDGAGAAVLAEGSDLLSTELVDNIHKLAYRFNRLIPLDDDVKSLFQIDHQIHGIQRINADAFKGRLPGDKAFVDMLVIS